MLNINAGAANASFLVPYTVRAMAQVVLGIADAFAIALLIPRGKAGRFPFVEDVAQAAQLAGRNRRRSHTS